MDQTIADIVQVYYFLLSLTVKEFVVAFCPDMLRYVPLTMEESLQEAYRLFVKRIAAKEASNEPIGILRPGIIDQMKRLEHSAILNVGIYSNNPSECNVRFIRDLIHQHTSRSIIGPCIHWNHPTREIDRQLHKYISKTWVTLRNILIEHGAPYDLAPEQVIFFDDQSHIAMEKALENNYRKVSEYHASYHMDQISTIYMSCIQDANVDVYQLYKCLVDLFHLSDLIHLTKSIAITDLIDLIYIMNDRTNLDLIEPTHPDVGMDQIRMTIDQIMDPTIRSTEILSPKTDCIEKCHLQ